MISWKRTIMAMVCCWCMNAMATKEVINFFEIKICCKNNNLLSVARIPVDMFVFRVVAMDGLAYLVFQVGCSCFLGLFA